MYRPGVGLSTFLNFWGRDSDISHYRENSYCQEKPRQSATLQGGGKKAKCQATRMNPRHMKIYCFTGQIYNKNVECDK